MKKDKQCIYPCKTQDIQDSRCCRSRLHEAPSVRPHGLKKMELVVLRKSEFRMIKRFCNLLKRDDYTHEISK